MHQRSLVLDHENDKCQPLVFWLFDMLKLSRKSCDLCDFRIVLLEYVEYFQYPLKIHHLLQYSILESLLSLKIYTVYDKCADLSDDAPLSYDRPPLPWPSILNTLFFPKGPFLLYGQSFQRKFLRLATSFLPT